MNGYRMHICIHHVLPESCIGFVLIPEYRIKHCSAFLQRSQYTHTHTQQIPIYSICRMCWMFDNNPNTLNGEITHFSLQYNRNVDRQTNILRCPIFLLGSYRAPSQRPGITKLLFVLPRIVVNFKWKKSRTTKAHKGNSQYPIRADAKVPVPRRLPIAPNNSISVSAFSPWWLSFLQNERVKVHIFILLCWYCLMLVGPESSRENEAADENCVCMCVCCL